MKLKIRLTNPCKYLKCFDELSELPYRCDKDSFCRHDADLGEYKLCAKWSLIAYETKDKKSEQKKGLEKKTEEEDEISTGNE